MTARTVPFIHHEHANVKQKEMYDVEKDLCPALGSRRIMMMMMIFFQFIT